ncbi:set domain-containing protein 5 [Botrytis cinerea]
MSSSTTDSMYSIREVPKKGKGLIATRMIPMGTCILSEEPIIRVPEAAHDIQSLQTSIHEQINSLNPEQRQAFLSMHNIHAGDAVPLYLGIIRTNALPLGIVLGKWEYSLTHAALIMPATTMLRKAGMRTLIDTLSMQNETLRMARRSQFSTSVFSTNANPVKRLFEENSRLLARVIFAPCHQTKVEKAIESWMRSSSWIIPLAEMGLYNELGPNDTGLPRAFFDAAQIAIAHSDLARAKIFIEQAVSGWTILEGDDSSNVLQHRALLQDPSKHELYGMSMRWRTTVSNVPQGLDLDEFEDWLWRREKPKQPGQLVSFRNRAIFPSFNDLPHENYVDLEFYACQSTGWNEKGHKADCKILKDADLNGLFSLDWDDFVDHIGFPLNNATVHGRSVVDPL